MAQKCVFCGGTPQNKNKEHVIPQWLSKYLGRYNSVCDLSGVTDLQIPFKGLTFPACEKCNSADSALEAAAKNVVEKMMSAQPVTGSEINTLLDWFDKLRIGIWLGQLMLSKKMDTIVPNFYINNRIALKDRMLIIEHIEGVGNGLGLVGSNNNMFQYSPNAFQEIHEAAGGGIGQLCSKDAGEAVADQILQRQNPAAFFQDFRVMVPEPGDQRRRLGRPGGLTGMGEQGPVNAAAAEIFGIIAGTVVGGDDHGIDRFAGFVGEDDATAVAGQTHSGHIAAMDAGLFQGLPDDQNVCLPDGVSVPLRPAGMGQVHRNLGSGNGDLVALQIKNGALNIAAAVIDAH